MIYLDRKIAALCTIVPDEETRPILNNVHIKGGKAHATDSYMAMTVDLPKVDDNKVHPVIDAGLTPLEVESVMLPAGQLARALRALPKQGKKPLDFAKRVAVLVKAGRDGLVELVAGRSVGDWQYPVKPGDGTYPDFDRAIAEGSSGGVAALAHFDGKKVVKLIRAHQEAGAEQGDTTGPMVVQFEILHAAGGVPGLLRLTTFDDEGRKAESILMPMAISTTDGGFAVKRS